MRSFTRFTTTLALLLALAGLQVQPLAANTATPAPAPGQGSVSVVCTAPTLVSVTIVWNPDGSGTRTSVWQQSCTTTFTSADGTTSISVQVHTWASVDYIPAPNPVPTPVDTAIGRGDLDGSLE